LLKKKSIKIYHFIIIKTIIIIIIIIIIIDNIINFIYYFNWTGCYYIGFGPVLALNLTCFRTIVFVCSLLSLLIIRVGLHMPVGFLVRTQINDWSKRFALFWEITQRTVVIPRRAQISHASRRNSEITQIINLKWGNVFMSRNSIISININWSSTVLLLRLLDTHIMIFVVHCKYY